MTSTDCIGTETLSKEPISVDHICNVNVNKLISDVQHLVVQLKESNEFASTINAATTVRDIVRQTNEGHMLLKRLDSSSGYNFESVDMESRPNCTYHLRELDAENRHLRSLYEDGQLTLLLVMQQHRKAILRFSKSDRERTSSKATKEMYEKLADQETKMAYNKFADVAVGINEIMKSEENRRKLAQEEIEDLMIKNTILRELLNSEDPRNIDIDALIDKMENKTPVPTPNTSVVYVGPVQKDEKDEKVEDEEIVEDPDHNKSQPTSSTTPAESSEFVPSF